MSNKYERYFSNWLYDNLPSSDTGLLIQDIDFCLQNYKTKKFLFIELKTRWNKITFPQKQFYNMLHKRLKKTNTVDWREYMWTQLIEFQWDNFKGWDVRLNWEHINEDLLIEKLWLAMWYKLRPHHWDLF